MENIYLQIAAEILNTTTDEFSGYPDDIKERMASSVETIAGVMQENLRLLHITLLNFAAIGMADEFMVKLSKKTDYDLETLRSIDQLSQEEIYFDYEDNEEIFGSEDALKIAHEQIEDALQITEICCVAESVGMRLEYLKKTYSHDTCVKLCKAYRELSERNAGKQQIVGALRDILQKGE